MDNITYVGLDTHKARICVAVAEGGRGGGWVFENRSEILCKLAARLSRGGQACLIIAWVFWRGALIEVTIR